MHANTFNHPARTPQVSERARWWGIYARYTIPISKFTLNAPSRHGYCPTYNTPYPRHTTAHMQEPPREEMQHNIHHNIKKRTQHATSGPMDTLQCVTLPCPRHCCTCVRTIGGLRYTRYTIIIIVIIMIGHVMFYYM